MLMTESCKYMSQHTEGRFQVLPNHQGRLEQSESN